ncbi:hypothetical protein G7059_02635 [Erysipelothrix sp. HDW6A]|uniref:hypothetical protein n=1 Tax=Erysipelothrix sp. HDW6A TaxID=2714928 RepID=UPI001407319C|nr:hypothetical protein [Erysipelothrix sp. HDW6A]QIK56818.1 hypothetical protein G7059_02635 [Erysipelothrix sp. HDW6A]
MKKIFWGKIALIFVFSFTYSKSFSYDMFGQQTVVSSHTIQILPAFIGWMIILQGVNEMLSYSDRFVSLKKFVSGLVVYSLIVFILNMIINSEGQLLKSLSFIATFVIVYSDYLLYKGIIDTESKTGLYLRGDRLMMKFKISLAIAISTIISPILVFISPLLVFVYAAAVVVVTLVNEILILIDLYNAQKTFTEYLWTKDDVIVEIDM